MERPGQGTALIPCCRSLRPERLRRKERERRISVPEQGRRLANALDFERVLPHTIARRFLFSYFAQPFHAENAFVPNNDPQEEALPLLNIHVIEVRWHKYLAAPPRQDRLPRRIAAQTPATTKGDYPPCNSVYKHFGEGYSNPQGRMSHSAAQECDTGR